MPRRKKCPICDRQVVKSRYGKHRWMCAGDGGIESVHVHYWYEYPIEIVKYGRLDFYIDSKRKVTCIIETEDFKGYRTVNHLPERPLYTCEECIKFSQKWDKLSILA